MRTETAACSFVILRPIADRENAQGPRGSHTVEALDRDRIGARV
jgi:hypothetical protein